MSADKSIKNVVRLAGVYSKASRLITKNNFRGYREKRLETYALYALAVVIGLIGGGVFGYCYTVVSDASLKTLLYNGMVGLLVTLPTLVILYSLFMTMMFQIKQSGVKVSVQPIYWFPVTWEEHTAASVLSSTFSGALWITILICSGILAASIPTGLLPIAILTSVMLFVSMAIAGISMEAFRVVQAGISGAVLKAAVKSAVWVRFITTITLFIVVYVLYFSATQSPMLLFNAISRGQIAIWFVPYVWPGVALYTFSQGLWLDTALLLLGTVAFTVALFVLAVRLNARYGLSDAPTISVSKAYKPGGGLLNRLGLSPAESAIVKKDIKAFTRRNELMYVFIMPIVILIATVMPVVMGNSGSRGLSGMGTFFFLYIVLMPPATLAMTLGMSLVGSEGERFWLLTSSPLPVKSFIRAKYFLQVSLCVVVALLCAVFGYFVSYPSPRLAATGIIEALLMVIAAGMIALFSGTAGADFRELPRPRMIQPVWSLTGMALCLIAGLLVLLPVLAYGVVATSGIMPPGSVNGAFLYVAWLLSGAIAIAFTYVFYRMTLVRADRLLYPEA